MGQRTITGTIYRPVTHLPWANAVLWFKLAAVQADQVNDLTYPATKQRVVTDLDGAFSVTVYVPNDELGAVPYDIYLPASNGSSIRVNVGSGDPIDLADLLNSGQAPVIGAGITVGGVTIGVPADAARSLRFVAEADSSELGAMTYDPVAGTLDITTAVGDVLINGQPVGAAPGGGGLAEGVRQSFAVVADNLDGYTTIAFGQRLVLRFQLSAVAERALVSIQPISNAYNGNVFSTGYTIVTGDFAVVGAKQITQSTWYPSFLAFPEYTKAVTTISATGVSYPVYAGMPASSLYVETNILLGWYSGQNRGYVSSQSESKVYIEGSWLSGDELHIAIVSAATAGGPFALDGQVHVIHL